MHNLFSETKARVKNKIQRNIDKNNNFSKMHTGTVGSGALCVMYAEFSQVLQNIWAQSCFHGGRDQKKQKQQNKTETKNPQKTKAAHQH